MRELLVADRQPGRDRRAAAAARAARRRRVERRPRRAADAGPTWSCRRRAPVVRRRSRAPRRGWPTCAPAARLRRRPAPTSAEHPGRLPRRSRADAWPPAARCSARSSTLLDGVRRPRRAEPQPAGGRGARTDDAGAQPARVLPHLPAEPRRRARSACPRRSGERLARVLAHYGVTDLDRTPELEEAVFRIFLAQQRAAADVAGRHVRAAALARATPPPEQALRRAGPRGARPAGRGDPAALPGRRRPGPQRRGSAGSTSRWSTTAGPSVLAGVPRRARPPRRHPDARRPRRAHRRAGRDPRAARALPRRAARAGHPRARADARGAGHAGTTASTSCTTCAASPPTAGRSSPADYTLDEPADPPGDHRRRTLDGARRVGRRRGPRHRARRAGRRGARRPRRPSSTSTCTWPGAPGHRRGGRPSCCRPCSAALALRPAAYAGSRSPVCPGGGTPGRPTSRSAPATGAGMRRGRPRPRPAPDGRPAAEPVAAARLRPHPARRARGRAALPLRRAGQPGPTSGSSRWRRCASSTVVRDDDGQRRRRCRTPSAPSPTAWRRSGGRARRRGARRCAARHEPRLRARLAGRRRAARAADRAAAGRSRR